MPGCVIFTEVLDCSVLTKVICYMSMTTKCAAFMTIGSEDLVYSVCICSLKSNGHDVDFGYDWCRTYVYNVDRACQLKSIFFPNLFKPVHLNHPSSSHKQLQEWTQPSAPESQALLPSPPLLWPYTATWYTEPSLYMFLRHWESHALLGEDILSSTWCGLKVRTSRRPTSYIATSLHLRIHCCKARSVSDLMVEWAEKVDLLAQFV